MSLPRLSINKPVTTFMAFAGIILLGYISLSKLPLALFPTITYPQITVVTSYENAAPEEIESLITKIIEEATGTVNNVKRISSISKEGLSLVMVEFNWGTNMDFAALNVREKIDLVKEKLPREAQEPIVMKYNPFDLPIMNLAVTGPLSALELREISRKYIKDAIEKIEGVASATISGGDEREILVEIDQPRLRASQISIVSVVDSLKAANMNYPAGTLKESFYEYLIRTMGEYQKVGEIQETPTALDIPEENAKTQQEKEEKEKQSRRLVFLKDIAKTKDTVKEKTSIARYNGKDSVSLVIRKQSGANTINVVRGIKKEIDKILAEKLPKGVKIQATYDQSQFIQEAIGNVRDAAVQGGILSFIVLFLFLWELKSSLIIMTAIPVCIAATTMLMYFSKIDLNVMSLGGLAMGVGMVVDSANIVIENITRYRQQLNKSFKDSIVEGADEMFPAIVGSTLTNIAVFLPFAFVIGIAGQIFKQLSFTISFSLVASILVAVSLVPALVSVWGESKNQKWITAKVDRATEKITGRFKQFVDILLQRRNTVISIITIIFVMSVFLLFTMERQFLPRVDQRQFIIKVDLPPGSRLETTDSAVRKVERLLLEIPETKDVTVNIGSSEEKVSAQETALQTLGTHQAQIMINLKKKSKKEGITRSTEDVIQILKTGLDKENMQGAEIEYVAQENSLGASLTANAPVVVEIKGPDLNTLTEISAYIQSRVKKIPGTYGIKTNMPQPSPETKLHILKDRASLYGLSVQDIAVTAQVALKGYVATKFKDKASQEDIDIKVRLRTQDREDLSNLRRLLIHSPLGMDIFMSEVAYLTKGVGPTEIKRTDQQRSIMVTANSYQRSLGQTIKEVSALTGAVRTKLPKDYSLEMAGEQQRMQESFSSLIFALILAFTLVYMIMAAEFESLWQPLLIMFTIPLSLIGVALILFITRTPLSVVAYLGIIMLGGIAVNNGIVLIEFVNNLRAKGYSPYDAALEASKTRLRPILMTSLTTILGLVPLAFGIGEGAELQAPLALTVMGGLTSAAFLTLVFIPALYINICEVFERKSTALPSSEVPLSPQEIKIGMEVTPQAREHREHAPEGFIRESFPFAPVKRKTTGPAILEVNLPGHSTPEPKPETLPEVKLPEPATQEENHEPGTPQAPAIEPGLPAQEPLTGPQPETFPEVKLPEPATQEENHEPGTPQAPAIEPGLPAQEPLTEPQPETLPEVKLPEPATQEENHEPGTPQAPAIEPGLPAQEPLTEPQPEILPEPAIQEENHEQKTLPTPRPEQQSATPVQPAFGTEQKSESELNPRQKDILEKLKTLKKITRKDYARMCNISIPTAARDLKEMVDKKLLQPQGPLGPGRWYELTS
ncbi:MAG: efflux RND transporter permease subunit [Candidatus Omnitrophica bacterium]|nr:efflux RND transporter permease subunit [Candidatus Omnitrophota bacterium]